MHELYQNYLVADCGWSREIAASYLGCSCEQHKSSKTFPVQAFLHASISALSSHTRFCKENTSLPWQFDASSVVSLNRLLLITSQLRPRGLGPQPSPRTGKEVGEPTTTSGQDLLGFSSQPLRCSSPLSVLSARAAPDDSACSFPSGFHAEIRAAAVQGKVEGAVLHRVKTISFVLLGGRPPPARNAPAGDAKQSQEPPRAEHLARCIRPTAPPATQHPARTNPPAAFCQHSCGCQRH